MKGTTIGRAMEMMAQSKMTRTGAEAPGRNDQPVGAGTGKSQVAPAKAMMDRTMKGPKAGF